MNAFPRTVLDEQAQTRTVALLQENLVNLIDLALQLKQAHWNVVGRNFRSVHMQLDEIIDRVRIGSDETAERIVALGTPADGRVGTLGTGSALTEYPAGLISASETIAAVADRLVVTIRGLRAAIDELGDLDPISEDLFIALVADLEKHLWMVQAQELTDPAEVSHA